MLNTSTANIMAAATAKEPGVWDFSVPNRSPAFVIVSIVLIIITTTFFAFRQGWRWAHHQRGWDDVMAACAYLLLVIMTILGGISCHYGFGKHMADIKPTLEEALFYFYLYQICYKMLGGFTKLTFCFLYLRIFNQKWFHWLVIIVGGIVVVGSFAFTLGTILQCIPVRRAWDRAVPGSCYNTMAFWYSQAAFNTFFDMVVCRPRFEKPSNLLANVDVDLCHAHSTYPRVEDGAWSDHGFDLHFCLGRLHNFSFDRAHGNAPWKCGEHRPDLGFNDCIYLDPD